MIKGILDCRSLILLIIFMLLTPSSFAERLAPYDALNSGDYQALQRIFSTIESNFRKGELTEYQLLDAYKVFYQRQDVFRKQLNSWVANYPDSPIAYLARGIYFRKLGEFRRGTEYIDKVPQDNINYMNQMFRLAKKDLEKSLQLDPRSYLAVLHLLNIAQFEGNDRAAKQYLLMGDKIFPENILMRARFLIHLTPRWGGSYPEMEQFIKEERQHGLPRDEEKLLIAIELDDQGNMAQQKGDIGLAIAKYQKALTLTESASSWVRHHYLQYSLQLCSSKAFHSKSYCL